MDARAIIGYGVLGVLIAMAIVVFIPKNCCVAESTEGFINPTDIRTNQGATRCPPGSVAFTDKAGNTSCCTNFNAATQKCEGNIVCTFSSNLLDKQPVCKPPATLGNTTWKLVPGQISQISRSGNVLCGVQPSGQIWCADQNVDSSPNWFRVVGTLKQVCIDKGRLIGVGTDGRVQFAANQKNPQWVATNGMLEQVEMDGNVVCGINKEGQVWCADQGLETGNLNWFLIDSIMNSVSVSGSYLMGTARDGRIQIADNYRKPAWRNVPGILKQAQLRGKVMCGVNFGDEIFCAEATMTDLSQWKRIPGSLKQIALTPEKIMGTNRSEQLWTGNVQEN